VELGNKTCSLEIPATHHWWLKRSQAVQARSKLISLEPKKYLIHKKKIKESQEKAPYVHGKFVLISKGTST
jgi:hypothetical protein